MTSRGEFFDHMFKEMRLQCVIESGSREALPTMVRYDWFDDQYRCLGCGHQLKYSANEDPKDLSVHTAARDHLTGCLAIIGLANRTVERLIQNSDPRMIDMMRFYPEQMTKILSNLNRKLETI